MIERETAPGDRGMSVRAMVVDGPSPPGEDPKSILLIPTAL